MTALRLSSAHWVRAFGLIPSAGRGFYDIETTIERGYPLFTCFSIIVLLPLSWQGHVHFHTVAFLCVSMSGWGRSLVDHFSTCIGWIGTSFTRNLGCYLVVGVGPAGFGVPPIRQRAVGAALTALPKYKYPPTFLIFPTFLFSLSSSILLIFLVSS